MQCTQRIVQAGALAGLLLSLGAIAPAGAQVPVRKPPALLGGNFMYARPQAEFLDAVKHGYGGSGFGLLPVGDGVLGLRADIGFIGYGKKHEDVAVTLPPYSFPARQTTENNIFLLTVGPQLMATSGPIRPYVNANAGLARFYTQSSLDDYESDYFPTTSTQSDNWKFTYGAGGGVYIPVVVASLPFMLDLGAVYQENGRTTYLTKNDISIDNNGVATINKRRTPVEFVTYRIGISVGL